MAVSMAPIGVVPLRMSKMAGAPPHTMGAPGWTSWWMVMPLRHSAACWVMAPNSVTGAAAPASGIETISAGTLGSGKLDQVVGPEFTPDKRRGGTHIEDRTRLFRKCLAPAAEDGKHFQHGLESLN